MAHVKEDMILWRGKNAVNGERQLDRTEVGSKMAAVFEDALHKEGADLLGKRSKLLARHGFKILRRVDLIQTGVAA